MCCLPCRRDPPEPDVIVPPAVIFTGPQVEVNLYCISHLIAFQLGDLVASERCDHDVGREVTVLVFKDEILFLPSTAGALAALFPKLLLDPAFYFQCCHIDE